MSLIAMIAVSLLWTGSILLARWDAGNRGYNEGLQVGFKDGIQATLEALESYDKEVKDKQV